MDATVELVGSGGVVSQEEDNPPQLLFARFAVGKERREKQLSQLALDVLRISLERIRLVLCFRLKH